jgi:hypothetical protein
MSSKLKVGVVISPKKLGSYFKNVNFKVSGQIFNTYTNCTKIYNK